MQKAIPYRDWLHTAATSVCSAAPPPGNSSSGEDLINESKSIEELVSENAVVVFARKGCCMCHVVKLLLHGHGVNPSIFDVDNDNEAGVKTELSKIIGTEAPQFPAVFVGGELFGGLEEVMGAHISGELVPRLRKAKALWL